MRCAFFESQVESLQRGDIRQGDGQKVHPVVKMFVNWHNLGHLPGGSIYDLPNRDAYVLLKLQALLQGLTEEDK